MRSSRSAGSSYFAQQPFEVDTAAVAAMTGVAPHVIRNWAARGHIQPLRTEGNRTIYDAEAVVRVAATFGHIPDLRDEDGGPCWAPHCEATTWPDVPVPLCIRHALAVWLHVNDEWYKRLATPPADGWRNGEWDPQLDRVGSQHHLVYFIQVGNRIKIGTTTNLPRRLTQLRSHCAEEPRVLLAVAGDATQEKQVHALFAEDRIRGEWFAPSARLNQFMAERFEQDIRNTHGPLLER